METPGASWFAGVNLRARVTDRLEAERERWALWLPVAFGAGIGAYFSLDSEPPAWLGAGALACAVMLGCFCRRRAGPLLAAIALGALAAGFAAAQSRSALVAAPVIEKRQGPLVLSGRILELEPRGGRARVTLGHLSIPDLSPEATPARVRITISRDLAGLDPGDWLRLRAVLRPPPEPAAPGAFDFARQAYFRGLGGVGFAAGKPLRIEPLEGAAPGASHAWRLWWSGLRRDIARRVLAVLSGEAGAVAAALTTGERGAISERVMQNMRDWGLAHLLAISGLHVGLVAGLLFFGLRAMLALVPSLALRHPIKKWAAVTATLGAFAYLFLVGATVPTQRAFLMTAMILLAVVLDRTAASLRLVAWAAFAVLLVAPESLLSASFQMSFAAVTALVAGYELLRERRARIFTERTIATRVTLYVAAVALTSVIAVAATAPFAVYHFNRIAWFGLAANLIAVPLTALWIMPWAIGAFLLLPLGLEALALRPMGWGIEGLLAVAAEVAGWPGAISVIPAMPTAGLVLITLGGLWLCLWRRPWRLAALPVILAGALTVPLADPPDLLASGSGKLFAVRSPDGGLLLSTARASRFEADVWRRRAGETDVMAWPETNAALGGRMRCDNLGCIYRAEGQVVALVQDSRALAEDCALASIVISRVPARRCRGPRVVIDRFDLWRYGGHALWLSPEGARVERVRDRRGRRPWVAWRGRD
jgi:competence protein ComEC